jgi:hypothetical protein
VKSLGRRYRTIGGRDGPDQPVWACLATMLLQVFCTAGWSGDDVGRTISAAKPTALANARPEGAI